MSGDPENPSEFATVVRRDSETTGPQAGSLEARASLALKLLAGINIAGVLLAMISPLLPVSTLLTVAFSAAAAVLAVLYVVEARAVDRRRPWAVAAVRPLLILLGASGISAVVIVLNGGTLRVPFDGLLAAWAWLGAPDRTLVAGRVRRAAPLVGAAGALLAAMVLAKPLFGWGGLFDVHRPDLQASLDVECGAPAVGLPRTITVSYDWSWTSTSLFPNQSDIVVIGWSGADAEGRPLYVIDEIPASGAGIYSGLTGYPSTALADQVGAESEASFRWAIELDERGFEPGGIRLQLMRPRGDPPGPNSVTFAASYVHLGLWRETTHVTCSW
ncbi:MAG: hypothetical protein HYX57_01705 [Chloroflexi bacterium]|nr:hypothetical protein [Chloroflexota bacterium]